MKKYGLYVMMVAAFALVALDSCQTTKSGTASKMLKFGFEKGRGYDYEMIINTDQEIEGEKRPMDMTSYYSMDVTEDDGKTKTISTKWERFKMRTGMMGMTIEIDSDKPLPNLGIAGAEKAMQMANGLLGAVKGKVFTIKVNEEGEVTEIAGVKEIAVAIADSFHLDGESREAMLTRFNEQFGDKNMKNRFERFLYIFPNKEVKVGDSWQKTTTGVVPFPGVYSSTYTVSEIEGDMVTLEEKTKISSSAGEGPKMEGEIKGELVVDSKTGLVVNADQDMSLIATNGGKTFSIKGKTKVKGKAR